MSTCNYCTLKHMRAHARARGMRIVTRRIQPKSAEDWGLGGINVHALRKGEKPSKENQRAWFMELTAHCEC